MTGSSLPVTSLEDERVVREIERYQSLPASQQRAVRDHLLNQFPEVAEELSACLNGLDLVAGLGPKVNEASHETMGEQLDDGATMSIGDYRIIRQLGRGGMGVVYEAEQLSLHRRVALKILPFAAVMDGKALQRFKNEALAAASLKHRHIVSVYSVGQDRGVHYYAMELVEGHNLAQVISRLDKKDSDASPNHTGTQNTAVDTPQLAALSTQRSSSSLDYHRSIARMMVQAAEAVDYAHQMGVVHRDIKPSNLMLDQNGSVWVTDFGLASTNSDASLTATAGLVGTPRYMSPEQAAGNNSVLDHRTDIYSLGLTFYEMITLRPAFAEQDRQRLLCEIMEQEPVTPRKVVKTIPHDLETIVLKSIAKEPQDRYDSAGELADDLRRFIDHKPIKARRFSRPEKAWRWSKRNPVMATLGATVACLLMFLSVAGPLVAFHERRVALETRVSLYVAQMNNAYHAWSVGDTGKTLRLLASFEPRSGEKNLCGFEWHYLWTQLHSLAKVPTLTHPTKPVISMAYCPDGETLVTGTWDPVIRLWDTRNHRIRNVLRGHTGGITALDVSRDGKTIISGSGNPDSSIRFWDITTSKQSLQLNGHKKRVTSVALSPNGKLLASSSDDGTVRLWNAQTGEAIMVLLEVQSNINTVAFSPDGRALAAGGNDHMGRIWDVATGALLHTVDHKYPIFAIAFAPDGKLFVTGGFGQRLNLWSVASGEMSRAIALPGEHRVHSLTFSSRGDLLISGGLDKTTRIWDPRNGEARGTIRGHQAKVNAVAFAPNGHLLATGSGDRTVKLWRVEDHLYQRPYEVAGIWQTPIAFADDKTLVAGKGLWFKQAEPESGELRVFDLRTGEKRAFGQQKTPVHAIALSQNGTLATGGGSPLTESGTVQLWNIAEGVRLHDLEQSVGLNWAGGRVYSVAFSSDGRYLAAGGGIEHEREGSVKVWDLQGTSKPLSLSDKSSYSVAFSPVDRKFLAVGGKNPTTVWNIETGEVHWKGPQRRWAVMTLVYSPDGNLVAEGDTNGAIRLLEAKTGEVLHKMSGHSTNVFSVAFSPDSKTLASVALGGGVRLWHVASGREIGYLEAPVTHDWVAFSPDGDTLAAGGADNRVSLWHASPRRQNWPVSLR